MLFYLATKMVIQFIYRTYYPWKTSVVQFGDQKCSQLGTRLSDIRLETRCLTSFPSSGNTWLRYLLEGATGIFTGSFYSDVQLTNSGKTTFYFCDQKRFHRRKILFLPRMTHHFCNWAWRRFCFEKSLLVNQTDSVSFLPWCFNSKALATFTRYVGYPALGCILQNFCQCSQAISGVWNSDSGGFYGEIFPWNSGRTCLVKSHGGFLKGHPNNLTIDHLLKCNRKGVLLIR